MPKGKDLPKKIKDLREAALMSSTNEFVTRYHEFTGKAPNTARNYAANEEEIDLRGDSADVFVDFWNQPAFAKFGITFEHQDLPCSYENFLARRGKGIEDKTVVPNHETSDADVHAHFAELVGSYQIIRPHAKDDDIYVLEALGIESDNGRICNTSYSHQGPPQAGMYSGKVELGQRYYCSLLTRRGERGPAYRCYTFFIGGNPRYKECLSGIMLRGMSGEESDEQQAVALPFIALPTSTTLSLRDPDMVELDPAKEHADRLRLLHRAGDIVLGKVQPHWYPGIFSYCRDIFTNPEFVEETRQHQVGLKTTPALTLKKMPRLTVEEWRKVTEDLKKALGKGVLKV